MNNISDVMDVSKEPLRFLSGIVEGFYGQPWSGKQRVELFRRMCGFGLSSYMYAPKDDLKHRADWREPYSLDELSRLHDLIHEASANNIQFFYAVSPGLDMIYSSSIERRLLFSKYKQVADLGCRNFAILFDDIEPQLSSLDKDHYSSFAEAHISVAHFIFENLGDCRFLFCPTEYCGSRAIPSVQDSEYLSTIGLHLDSRIDFMWTGPQVISRDIDVSSLIELRSVIRRKPVIWDNLHANDYDQRRIFLGPYNRSPDILPHIGGVFTNPNCELEANFIAFDTLGSFLKIGMSHVSGESFHAGRPYCPRLALDDSICKWVGEFSVMRSEDEERPMRMSQKASDGLINTYSSTSPRVSFTSDSNFDRGNSTHAPDVDVMDFAAHSSLTPIDSPVFPRRKTEIDGEFGDSFLQRENEIDPATFTTSGLYRANEEVTEFNIRLLVDLFYLPFEHGATAQALLDNLKWLRQNASRLKRHSRNGEFQTSLDIVEWEEKARQFDNQCHQINDMCIKLANRSRNRLLLHELFPYFWDLKGIISRLRPAVKWLENSQSGSYVNRSLEEPWISRGSLFADLQDLLPSVPEIVDVHGDDSPSLYIVRPYLPEDKELIYSFCREVYNCDKMSSFPETPNIFGDLIVGFFLRSFPEHTCVLENGNKEICGYFTGTNQPTKFHEALQFDWNNEMARRYSDENGKSAAIKDIFESRLRSSDLSIPEFAGLIQMSLLPSVCDAVANRLLECGLSTLKLKPGSEIGAYVNRDNWQMWNVYQSLGFQELTEFTKENSVIMIRQVV